MSNVLEVLGWTPKACENALFPMLRPVVIGALSTTNVSKERYLSIYDKMSDERYLFINICSALSTTNMSKERYLFVYIGVL